MKLIKKTTMICVAIVVAMLISPAALAAGDSYGANAINEEQSYELEQMLTNALEDEYLAMTKYAAIIQEYGEIRPLAKIFSAERAHVALLKPLFNKYGISIPPNRAAGHFQVPSTLRDAFRKCMERENSTIQMYNFFLRQELPEDVKIVFTVLRTASANHRKAFEHTISHSEDRNI